MCLKPSWDAENKDNGELDCVQDILLDQWYWISVNETIQLFEPLIKVLRIVDSDDKAEMSFLYNKKYGEKKKKLH